MKKSKDDGCINAGIMLFNAGKMRRDSMKDILVAKRRSLGNRSSMDQQTYNMVIKDSIKYLGIRYNCVPGRLTGDVRMDYSIDELNRLYGTNYRNAREVIEDAVIVHFATGNKPWKYTFAPCAKKWMIIIYCLHMGISRLNDTVDGSINSSHGQNLEKEQMEWD